MKDLIMDGADWNTPDDFYDAFFRVVGAPSWHGRNFNAVNDSIATGSINEIEVPYRLVIRNFDLVGVGARKMAEDFVDLIRELAAGGTPVEIAIQNSP